MGGRLFGSVAIAALVWSATAHAQTAPETTDLDELVVTAQKRTERLVDVPVAVTAVAGETLSEAQVTGVAGLQQLAPSLTFTQSTNDLNNNVRIRGVGTALFNVGLESSVSFVLDGVVLSRQGQGFQDLIDIERVEILRGPQGTLFGKNATAGVINVVTQRPSATWTGLFEAVAAQDDEYRLRASVSGPLSPTARMRITGFYNDVGGHIENVTTGEKYNGGLSYGLRAKLDVDVTDQLNVLVIADARKSEADCCQFQARAFVNPAALAALAPVVPSPENDRVRNDAPTFNNTEQWGASVEANLELGSHTVTSISAFRTWDFENNIDVDGIDTSSPLFLLPLVATGIGQFNVNGGRTEIEQFSQEIRLTSPSGGTLEYVFGLYYFELNLDRSFQRRVAFCLPGGANGPLVTGAPCAVPQFRSTFHNANTQTRNLAAFGQGTWRISEPLALIAGFRAQHEEVAYKGNRPGAGLVAGDIPLLGASAGSAEVEDTDLSGKLGLQYRIARDTQAYATYTRGYKGRGYDVEVTANFATQQPVRPETVDAYELGFKTVLAEGRLSLNAAAFYQAYQDLQVQATVQVNGLNQFVQTNAGESISKGVELEFAARPLEGLSLSGGVTYLEADIDTTGTNCNLAQAAAVLPVGTIPPSNTCFRYVGEAAGTNRQNVNGGRLPNAPKVRANLTARYERQVAASGLVGFVQASAAHQSSTIFSLEQDPLSEQKAYTTVDASVGVRDAERRYQLTVFVKNLFDQSYATSIFRDAFFGNAASANNLSHYLPKEAARYVGASLRLSF